MLLPPLQLEPQHPLHIPNVLLHELFSRLVIVHIEVGEDAGVSAHLEGFVHHVIQTGTKHLGPTGATSSCPLQRDPHMRRFNTGSHATGGGANPQISLVGDGLVDLGEKDIGGIEDSFALKTHSFLRDSSFFNLDSFFFIPL